jgi:hypothetical protein
VYRGRSTSTPRRHKAPGVREGQDKRIGRVLVQRCLSARNSQRMEQAKLCFAWAGPGGMAARPDTQVVCRGCLKTAAEFIGVWSDVIGACLQFSLR